MRNHRMPFLLAKSAGKSGERRTAERKKAIKCVFTIFLIPAEPRYNRGSAGIFKFSNAAPFFENVLSGKSKVFCKGEFFLDK